MKSVFGSFQEIVYRLIGSATLEAQAVSAAAPQQPTRFPIVVRPETRVFLEAQAKAFGGSMAGLAGALLDGLAMSEVADPAFRVDTLAKRLHLLINEHGLSIPAAAEVLRPFGITVVDLGDQEKLLGKLDVHTLERIAKHFHVNYEWLAGKGRYPTSLSGHAWYKNQVGAARTMVEAMKSCDRVQLIIVRTGTFDYETAKDDDKYTGEDDAPLFTPILCLERDIGHSESYTTYWPWEEGRWSYWRCREHIKMVTHFALELAKVHGHRVSISGRSWSREKYQQLQGGQLLCASMFPDQGSAPWHPDDYVETWSSAAKDPEEWVDILGRSDYKQEFAEFNRLVTS